jgi:hypothetical protein
VPLSSGLGTGRRRRREGQSLLEPRVVPSAASRCCVDKCDCNRSQGCLRASTSRDSGVQPEGRGKLEMSAREARYDQAVGTRDWRKLFMRAFSLILLSEEGTSGEDGQSLMADRVVTGLRTSRNV